MNDNRFIVTLATCDMSELLSVSSRCVTGPDAESVARARLTEAIEQTKQFWEEAEAICGTAIPWEESPQYDSLEPEEKKAYMLNDMHATFKVYVFTLDGTPIDLAVPLPD